MFPWQSGDALRLRWKGAPPGRIAEGLDRVETISNYYRGQKATRWVEGVPHFAKVRYPQIYPGIDLEFYGNAGDLEFDLVVAPGADPGRIRLVLDGADQASIDGAGNLLVARG